VDVDGIKTYYFRNLSSYLAREMVLPIPYYLPIVARKEIRDFDIIHIHELRTVLAVIVRYYANKYGIPYILQPRGSVPTIGKSKQKKLFDILFGRAIIRDATKIIASSKIESDQYRDVFPKLKDEKIVHMPNGIDLETYQNLPQKGEFKKKYSINADEKIILFLSRIHERKGADTLIEAFTKLKSEFENAKLVIAGPDEGYLDKLKLIVSKLNIESDVIFPGPLYEKDKLEAYVDAGVFVLPSKNRYESFGNVVLEACACGTPVIVTNNCGVSEWINNEVGYVVEYDKDQLRDAIFKILSDEGLRKRFGEEGKKLVMEEFGWDGIVRKIEGVYEDCIRG
jgi:glycosyltransferase involved in cell wall biosynthesis